MQPLSIGYDVTDGRPALKAWAERVKSKLSPHFESAHKIVYKVRDTIAARL